MLSLHHAKLEFVRKIIFFILLCFVLNSFKLVAQIKDISFSKELRVVKPDSSVHYGTLVLYNDLSTEWIVSSRSVNLSVSDSLRAVLKDSVAASLVFNEHWSNSILFPYPDEKLQYMTDSIEIDLLKNSGFYMPPNEYIFSEFGWRRGRQHKGIDLDLDIGDTLRAAFSGKVRFADYNNGGYGNLVIIRHFNGLETYYAHLDKLLISPNDIVLAGDVIGLGGETGNALGPHLHFEVRYHDIAFNPKNIIDFEKNNLVIVNENSEYNLTKADFAWLAKNESRKFYKVEAGDFLGKIAKKNGLTLKKILKLNPKISDPNALKIGQSIRVR